MANLGGRLFASFSSRHRINPKPPNTASASATVPMAASVIKPLRRKLTRASSTRNSTWLRFMRVHPTWNVADNGTSIQHHHALAHSVYHVFIMAGDKHRCAADVDVAE